MTQNIEKKPKRFKLGGVIAVVALILFYACPIYFVADAAHRYFFPPTTCNNVTIPHTTNRVDDPNIKSGETITASAGVDGLDYVCMRSGSEVSRKNLRSATAEVINVGTKIEIPQPYVPPVTSRSTYRTGAICSDGSISYATGRGACSWHGGVSDWLYE